MGEDDLRYPSVAYPYVEELPISEIPVGLGSMPGSKKEEVEEAELISGRGLVP